MLCKAAIGYLPIWVCLLCLALPVLLIASTYHACLLCILDYIGNLHCELY